MMKTKWMMMVAMTLLALTGCAATPDDEKEPSTSEVKVDVAGEEGKTDPQMKPSCMVNDDSTEAICCSTRTCWYVNLRDDLDPYSYR